MTTVKLVPTDDAAEFEIPVAQLTHFRTLHNIYEDTQSESIVLFNTTTAVFKKLLEMATAEPPPSADLLATEYNEDLIGLFDLIQCARFQQAEELVNLLQETIGQFVAAKDGEEIRHTFSLDSGFTLEEQTQINRQVKTFFEKAEIRHKKEVAEVKAELEKEFDD